MRLRRSVKKPWPSWIKPRGLSKMLETGSIRCVCLGSISELPSSQVEVDKTVMVVHPLAVYDVEEITRPSSAQRLVPMPLLRSVRELSSLCLLCWCWSWSTSAWLSSCWWWCLPIHLRGGVSREGGTGWWSHSNHWLCGGTRGCVEPEPEWQRNLWSAVCGPDGSTRFWFWQFEQGSVYFNCFFECGSWWKARKPSSSYVGPWGRSDFVFHWVFKSTWSYHRLPWGLSSF